MIKFFKCGLIPVTYYTFLSIFSFFSLSNWLSYHVWAASSRGVSEIGSMMAAQRYNCVKIGSHLTLHDLGCHTTTMFATPQGVNYCDRTSSWEMMPLHSASFIDYKTNLHVAVQEDQTARTLDQTNTYFHSWQEKKSNT